MQQQPEQVGLAGHAVGPVLRVRVRLHRIEHEAPAFFDTQMLYKVKTEVEQGADNPEEVDTWTLGYDWLAGDVNWDLVLATVQHEGWVGGSGASRPPVQFGWTGHEQPGQLRRELPADVPVPADLDPLRNRSRTHVAYNPGNCNPSELFGDAAISGNTLPCFPQKWTGGDFGGNPTNLWYYKYTVGAVTVSDPTGGGQVMPTTYEYCNSFHCGAQDTGANWHYDVDNDLVPSKDKSWAEWRGYNYVQRHQRHRRRPVGDRLHVPGRHGRRPAAVLVLQQRLDHKFGDDHAAGPDERPAGRSGNHADPVTDSNALNGFLLEKVVWNGLHSTEWAGTGTVSDTVNWPWVSSPTATSSVQPWGGSNYAEITDTAETDIYTPLSPLNDRRGRLWI